MPTPSTNNDAQLILQAINRVEAVVTGLDGRVRALEQAMIEQTVGSSNKLDAMFRRVDEHKILIDSLGSEIDCQVKERKDVTDKLERRVQSVEVVAAFAKWLGALFLTLAIVLIWAVLTHTVTLTQAIP